MNKKYVVDDRRPSLMPAIGSVAVAIGSLSAAAVYASPTMFPTLTDGDWARSRDAFGNEISSAAASSTAANSAGESNAVSGGSHLGTNPPSPTDQEVSVETANSIVFDGVTESAVDSALPSQIAPVPATASAGAPDLGGVSFSNLSSPTPTAEGSASWASEESTGNASGAANLSSPTPGGGVYDDDDDDDYDDYDDHDDEDDDDDDDDDDD